MYTDFTRAYPIAISPIAPCTGLIQRFSMGELDPVGNLWRSDELQRVLPIIRIIQVGAGGTGGYVAAEILRFLGSLPETLKNMFEFTLIDGDEFEPKNLQRQLCSEEDMGVNKAEALIYNYGSFFGCKMENLTAIPEYLTTSEQLFTIERGLPASIYSPIILEDGIPNTYMRTDMRSCKFREETGLRPVIPIILDCVDKTTPRKLIHEALERVRERVNFDCFVKNLGITLFSLRIPRPEYKAWKGDLTFDTSYGFRGVAAYYNCDDQTVEWAIPSDGRYAARYDRNPLLQANSEAYIISSGNSQYTGQVYWGRYSLMNLGSDAITYRDVWGDVDVSPFNGNMRSELLLDDSKQQHIFQDTPDKMVYPVLTNPSIATPEKPDFTRELLDTNLAYYQIKANFYSAQYSNHIPEDQLITNWAERIKARNFSHYAPLFINSNGNAQVHPMLNDFKTFASAYISVPSPYLKFPNLIDPEVDKREEQLSCAERAAHNVQNINANKTAAMLMVNYLSAIIYSKLPLEFQLPLPLTSAGTTFDIRTNRFVNEPITIDYLREMDARSTTDDHNNAQDINTVRGI